MTDDRDDFPDDYRDRVEELESDLGREICGFPDANLEPCEKWPAGESGRCSEHADRDLEAGFDDATSNPPRSFPDSLSPDATFKSPQTAFQIARPSYSPPEVLKGLSESRLYWIGLILVGLLLGAGVAGLTVDFSGTVPIAVTGQVSEINIDNPNFNRIRQFYREGNYREVSRRLNVLENNTSDTSVKSRVLYYRFVFHQNQKNYTQAVDVADRFIEAFTNHYRRAEIIYGAWYISAQILNNQRAARRYRRLLNDQYPDSKWSRRLSS